MAITPGNWLIPTCKVIDYEAAHAMTVNDFADRDYVMRGGLRLIFWFATVERINLNWRLGALNSAVR